MPGRANVERRREPGEAPKGSKMSKVGTKITCSLCHRKGHNMKSCKNNPNVAGNVNAHIVKQSAKKRKANKAAFEAENAKKASKGKAPAPQPTTCKKKEAALKILEAASTRKQTALKIGGSESSQTTSQPSTMTRLQPSHCVFNLASFKAAKMAKNGNEGSSSRK